MVREKSRGPYISRQPRIGEMIISIIANIFFTCVHKADSESHYPTLLLSPSSPLL